MKKYEAASGQGRDGGTMVTDGGNGSNDLLLYTHGEENVGGIGSMQDGGRGDWALIAQNDGLRGRTRMVGRVSSWLTHTGEGGPSGEHGTRQGQTKGGARKWMGWRGGESREDQAT